MGISHIDIAAVVPVTITKNPSTTSGWHAGRLPSRYDDNDSNAPVEWKSLDKRLSYWLSPTSKDRRWYRRPGDDYFDPDHPEDADLKLRNLLDTRFGTDLDTDRGDEIHLGAGRIVGLDGVDLIRIHDGADDNGIAVIRLLLYIPTHMPDVILEELALLRAVLRDFALYASEGGRSASSSLRGLAHSGSDSRSKVYGLYKALLEPVARIAPDDGTLPSCKLMTQIILGEDITDDDEQAQTEAMGTEARVAQLMRLTTLDGRLTSLESPPSSEQTIVHLPEDAASISIGASGLVVVHEGDGDFIRYRDVYLLSEMQGSLITAVDNGLFVAGFGEESRRTGKLGKFLVADPVTSAFKQMHWNGIVSTDAALQKVYDEAVRTNRTEQRLASTRSELAEANDIVARGAEYTMNWLLMTLAIFAFAVPIGLTIAQFQEPWPVVWMLPIGLGIGAVLACAFWFAFRRKLRRG